MALIWNQSCRAHCETVELIQRHLQSLAPDWQLVLNQGGLRVSCAGIRTGSSRAHVLHDESGVLLGTLFGRDRGAVESSIPRITKLGQRETSSIVESAGRELITSYWGRYIAFLRDPARNSTRVIRDPTGELPCFFTSLRGVTVVFSCLSDCSHLPFVRFTVNWQYMATRLACGGGTAEQTGLNEVSEVYGGECVEFLDDRASRAAYWNPYAIANAHVEDDPDRAARRLRSTAEACTHAWASCYPGILHRLSGGLDSSIVLALLSSAPSQPQVTCFTGFWPAGNSDERPYARLAAKRAGCQHIEIARDPERIVFANLLRAEPSAHPSSCDYSYLELSSIERQLAHEHNCAAISTGVGGDALFGSASKKLAATDFVRVYGVRRKLLEIAAGVAQLSNCSIWKVLRDALRDGLFEREWNILKTLQYDHRKLLNMDVFQTVSSRKNYPHPWYRAVDDAPRGTVMLILGLAMPRDFYDPLSAPKESAPEPMHPLFSQPLVEACLQIPSYLHALGWRDRGLARTAFANDLPPEIARRQWKDRAQGFLETAFMSNLKFFRELLLDGMLVKEKLLDRRRLEDALAGTPAKSGVYIGEIVDCLLVETWLRRWATFQDRRAAA